MRNLILTGFMGSGKSRIGRLLSERLDRPFIDMDRVIEQRQNKTISQIFSDYGEDYFRELEKQLCFELSQKKGQVIATGGGTWAHSANRNFFLKDSVFCLTAPFEVLKERISISSKRPLADQAKKKWIERRDVYASIFHQINTAQYSAEQAAERIQNLFNLDSQFGCAPVDFYPIVIRSGALEEIDDFLDWLSIKNFVLISNPEISRFYLKDRETIWIQSGERNKNLQTVSKIYTQLLQKNITRYDTLLALGGGIVGDITGFVAATYFRGVSYVQIPTTLLAMVDSCVGGKTGVDLPEGKNLIGAFKNPKAILLDPNVLKTLPEAELKCGLAEIVKHALVGDSELFEYLESGKLDFEFLIRRAIQVKIQIVQEDPFEQDRRFLLNLGHTFGHALEVLSNYTLRHGEAVSIGMVQAARFAQSKIALRIQNLLTRLGLPTELPDGITEEALWDAMKYDKKRRQDKLRLVLPYDLEDVRLIEV